MPQKRPIIIGLIHAEWCAACRNLMPAWSKMEANISNRNYNPRPEYKIIEHANLGELDHFNAKNAAYLQDQRVQANGFPTIFKVKDGHIEYYNDSDRSPKALEEWFMGKPPVSSASSSSKSSRYRSKTRSSHGGRKATAARRRASRRRRRTIKNYQH